MAVSSIGCQRNGCGKLRARVARDPPLEGESVIDVRIETFKDMHVARIRHVGPYAEVRPCFERLFKWAASVGAPTGRVLTLSHDNPNAVAPERLRSDVCVELRTEAVPPPGIETGPVGGGRYGVYRLKGSHEGIDEAYRWLFGAWLPESGEAVDGRPCMELYRNTPHDTASPEHLATDLCVPLRGRGHG
ncbi:AraC family transcriptional regulator [Candidatus Rariloculus sp.]|uniref:AraC family transcriptional regulator n=1 Tax=Candidatus Rariloculus sp. TaxID=3101265 RepID=UPI003D0E6790